MSQFDELLSAVALGVVQAATEFLPISSSGHLVIVSEVIGTDVSSLTFDIGLHVGTGLAIVAHFWRDWQRISLASLRDLRRHRLRFDRWSAHGQLGLWILLGSLPLVLAGPFLVRPIEAMLRDPLPVAAMLIVFAAVIWALDRWGPSATGLLDLTAGRVLVIGASQVLAVVPGVSRSGITIAAARGLGVKRDAAARFSFLLSTPVVFGAGVLRAAETVNSGETLLWGPLLVGMATSAVVGVLVIRWLLGYLENGSLAPFMLYRVGLGGGVVAASLAATFLR